MLGEDDRRPEGEPGLLGIDPSESLGQRVLGPIGPKRPCDTPDRSAWVEIHGIAVHGVAALEETLHTWRS